MSHAFSNGPLDQNNQPANRYDNGKIATKRTQWASVRHRDGMSLDSFGAADRVSSPPVAAKSSDNNYILRSTESKDGRADETQTTSSSQSKRDAFKRSYSVDTGLSSKAPKMGGSFAKLAAQLEKDPTSPPTISNTSPSSSTSSSSGLYRDKFEAYKARRSLELHGCLPPSMRANAEQQRKYSLDLQQSSSSSSTPRGAPRRSSVENRRDSFARNRSMTSPILPSFTSSPSGSVFNNDAFISSLPNKSRASSISSSISNQDVIPEESIGNINAGSGGCGDGIIFEIDQVEIAHAETSPAVLQMKKQIAKEKYKTQEAKKDLDSTIDELESLVVSLEVGESDHGRELLGNNTSLPKNHQLSKTMNLNKKKIMNADNKNNNHNDEYLVQSKNEANTF